MKINKDFEIAKEDFDTSYAKILKKRAKRLKTGGKSLSAHKSVKPTRSGVPRGLKVKSGFRWDNIGKVTDSEGGEYRLKKVNEREVRLTGKNQNHVLPIKLVFSLVNIYDKQGNLVNDKNDYR